MNTTLEQRAKQLFNNPLASNLLNEHNAKQWVAAVEWLADKWILKTKVERKVK